PWTLGYCSTVHFSESTGSPSTFSLFPLAKIAFLRVGGRREDAVEHFDPIGQLSDPYVLVWSMLVVVVVDHGDDQGGDVQGTDEMRRGDGPSHGTDLYDLPVKGCAQVLEQEFAIGILWIGAEGRGHCALLQGDDLVMGQTLLLAWNMVQDRKSLFFDMLPYQILQMFPIGFHDQSQVQGSRCGSRDDGPGPFPDPGGLEAPDVQ